MNNWYKKFAQETNIFGDDKDWFKKLTDGMPKQVSKDEPKVEDVELTLWNGFYGPLSRFDRKGDTLVISPEKNEQGAIWFTHKLITGYDPIDYATSHGDYLLTYSLQCKKHIQIVHFDDGSTSERIPEHINGLTNVFENNKYYMGFELPEGWFFSYKNEKFIICTIPLTVTTQMIKKI